MHEGNAVRKWFSCRAEIKDVMYINPYLLAMLCEAIVFAKTIGKDIDVTSLLREYGDGISQSTTHQEGRAIDISVKGWLAHEIESLANHLNGRFAKTIGTAPAGKAPVACYFHNSGQGDHFHLQVRRGLENNNISIDII